MDTNKIVIGNVYQIVKWERKFDFINYKCNKIKENSLLFRQSNDVFMDVETGLYYNVNIDSSRQLGDAIVFSNSVTLFNPFLKESDKCNDAPTRKIVKTFKKIKSSVVAQSTNK